MGQLLGHGRHLEPARPLPALAEHHVDVDQPETRAVAILDRHAKGWPGEIPVRVGIVGGIHHPYRVAPGQHGIVFAVGASAPGGADAGIESGRGQARRLVRVHHLLQGDDVVILEDAAEALALGLAVVGPALAQTQAVLGQHAKVGRGRNRRQQQNERESHQSHDHSLVVYISGTPLL